MMTTAEIASAVKAGPILVSSVLAHFHGMLTREILDEERRSPHPSGSLNRGGWKSTDTMFHRAGTAACSWRSYIESVRLGGVRINPWAMVNRKGSEHRRHQHTMAQICGVYYVTAGQPAVPTIFEVGDDEISVDPVAGQLVLFSGQTWHRVPRYDGDHPRITIAFDVVR